VKLSDIKKKHTRIEKNKDQFGRTFYILVLVIDHQSFAVGSTFSDMKTAKWTQRQLALALQRLLTDKGDV